MSASASSTTSCGMRSNITSRPLASSMACCVFFAHRFSISRSPGGAVVGELLRNHGDVAIRDHLVHVGLQRVEHLDVRGIELAQLPHDDLALILR